MDHWAKLRHIEGAAQRVQEDTQRFARIVEGLGVSFVRSMMTLIAFLPLLYTLSEKVTELPFFGPVDGAMVYVAIMSALLGTVLLAIVGIKLPGLEFNNQKVEAAYRKELVYGEDREDRAQPATVRELYEGVRKNYYRLYFNYLYFNVARFAYLQGSSFIPFIALGPTIVSGTITLGIFTQINNAFDRVEESFKFFANVWTTIIDLISIYKRLISFEKIIYQDEDTQSGATSAPAE
jgi:peptide/bleomycin uptake transporter